MAAQFNQKLIEKPLASILLNLTAMTPYGQPRNFSFYASDLEAAYNVLQDIIQKGDTLLNVSLGDERGHFSMPIDELDRSSFVNPIIPLRQQWETLLAHPERSHSEQNEFQKRRIELRQKRLASVRGTLSRTTELLDRAQQQLPDSPRKTTLICHYQRILDQYSRLLMRLETEYNN